MGDPADGAAASQGAPHPRYADEQLEIIVEVMAAAAARCSRDLRYQWVSQPYADCFGLRVDEVVGQRIADVIGAEAFAAIRPYIDRVLGGERVEYDQRIPLRGRGLRWLHAVYTPTYDGGTEPTGWVAVVKDITDQRQVEESLQQSGLAARWLAAIVESSDDAIISKDLDGTITSWNQGAERIFGYRSAEVVGRSIRIIIPADRQSEEDEVLARIRRGERVEHFQTIRQRKDGKRIAISLTISPIRDASGTVVGASKIARDVSEQQNNARRTAFMAEAGAVLGSSLDYESTLKAIANLAVPAVADWCAVDILRDSQIERLAVEHVDPAKVVLAKTVLTRYEDPKSPHSVHSVIRTGKPVLLPEITDEMIVAAAKGDAERVRIVRSLGLRSYLCVPLISHGQTLGALSLVTAESGRRYSDDDLGFAQDIAYRAALAVDNARAYEQMQQANRLKDEFLATLSHELRTPLNAILGYARMIRSGLLTGEHQERGIATLERNATSLTQIVEDVLDVSRIVSGKLRLDVQPVDVPSVVQNAMDTILPAANAKGVRIKFVADPRAAPVSGDPERLQQVVWNLVSNAVKFTPRGGNVQVRVERVDSQIQIVVSDTGVGIPSDFLPHIFQRFRQANPGTTREHGGLGLGLAIARHLVEMHGGTIHAASAGPGTGATFRVSLPVMIVHRDSHVEKRKRPRQIPGEPAIPIPNLAGIRILAVDDDRDALTLVREILETTGAKVFTADSAVAALDMLETFSPNVIIADLGMPHMDGYELITSVRSLSSPSLREIPAAALTAYARSEDRAKALRTGFQMHLAKPIDPGELMAAVAALAKRNTPA